MNEPKQYEIKRGQETATIVRNVGGQLTQTYREVKTWDIYLDGKMVAGGLTAPGFQSQRARFPTKAAAERWIETQEWVAAEAARRATNPKA